MSERSEQLRYCFCHGNIILISLTCELFKHKIGYSGSNTAKCPLALITQLQGSSKGFFNPKPTAP